MSAIAGTLFVVSAPSGAGKSSLLQALCQRHPELRVAVSHTTRPPRPGERNGTHYHFLDQKTFLGMIEGGEFLEHAKVFDHMYGTAEVEVQRVLNLGHDLILEIDWQGACQVRRRFPNACCIFILPPSLEALRERLAMRAQDSAAIIERRMRDAQRELAHYPEYDYLVVNDCFERALDALHGIIIAQNLRTERQTPRLATMLSDLLVGAVFSLDPNF